MPALGMKAAQASKAVVAARKALAAQAAAGKDPRKDPEVNRRRAAAISERHRRNREWKRVRTPTVCTMRRGFGETCCRSSMASHLKR